MSDYVVVCGGIHPMELTNSFFDSWNSFSKTNYVVDSLIFPTNKYPAYDGQQIFRYIIKNKINTHSDSLTFFAFSAGVVGAMGAARLWQRKGGRVKGFFAFDGWGVPLVADFPIHCFSHDQFTHHTSTFWVKNQDHFSAYPSVSHLDIWRSPFNLNGYWHKKNNQKIICKGGEFIDFWLKQYINLQTNLTE